MREAIAEKAAAAEEVASAEDADELEASYDPPSDGFLVLSR